MTTMRLSWPWAHLVAVFCLFAIMPGTSRAQAHGTYEESVQQGVVEYKAGNFEEAQALFRHAHALDPNARTWRGLGICAFELRFYVEATADLEAALADSRKPLTADQRTETKQLLEKARAFVSSYHLRTVPADAHVAVDGKAAQLHDGTLLLDPGNHVLIVSAPGYAEQRTELRTGAGLREDLLIELALADGPRIAQHGVASGPPPDDEPRSQPRPAKRRHIWTWSLGLGAVAAATAAVALRLRENGLRKELTDCRNHEGDCRAVQHKGEHVQLGSRISGALAGGLALGAVIAFVVERNHGESEKTTALLLGPQSLAIRSTF